MGQTHILIYAIRGMGKTSLVRNLVGFFNRNVVYCFVSKIAWINVSEGIVGQLLNLENWLFSHNIKNELKDLVEKGKLEQAVVKLAIILNGEPGRNLLIVDNLIVNNTQDDDREWKLFRLFKTHCRWSIIATSYQKVSGFEIFELSAIKKSRLIKYFQGYYSYSSNFSQDFEELLAIDFAGHL